MIRLKISTCWVVARQAEEIGSLIGALANGDSLSRRSAIKENALFVEPEFTESNRYFGSRALARRPASSIPDWPVDGAIIQIVRHRGDRRDQAGYEFKPASIPAYDNFTLACANVYGAYHYGPFEASRTQAWGLAVGFSQQGLGRVRLRLCPAPLSSHPSESLSRLSRGRRIAHTTAARQSMGDGCSLGQ